MFHVADPTQALCATVKPFRIGFSSVLDSVRNTCGVREEIGTLPFNKRTKYLSILEAGGGLQILLSSFRGSNEEKGCRGLAPLDPLYLQG